jgi:hypothetical protein
MPEGGWGRWLRQIELDVPAGTGMTVMSGAEGKPLLVLDRVEEGRVALMASDQAWLWSRGYEGGGPQLELLRRLAHWMMKEPELEEEALTARAEGSRVTVIRRTLETGAREVSVTGPDGTVIVLPLAESQPGLYSAGFDAPAMGLYRLTEGDREAVIAVGPSAPKEFEATLASVEALAPVITPTGGGTIRLEDGTPTLRPVRPGRTAAGRGWIGYVPRDAFVVEALRIPPLAPPWLMLLIAAALAVAAWLVEGRRLHN